MTPSRRSNDWGAICCEGQVDTVSIWTQVNPTQISLQNNRTCKVCFWGWALQNTRLTCSMNKLLRDVLFRFVLIEADLWLFASKSGQHAVILSKDSSTTHDCTV